MKKILIALVVLCTTLLAACGSSNTNPTPTPVDVNALQTAAVLTVVANVTQTAAAFTSTPEPPTATTVPPSATIQPTPDGTATLSICDDAIYIADVSVPDGTQLNAGEEFVKTWKVKNTGSCTWTTTYQLILSHGDAMSGQSTYLKIEVLPDVEAEISINLKAPTKPGTYYGYWRLRSNNGVNFGERLSVVIVVP